jgi:hypothetical protein
MTTRPIDTRTAELVGRASTDEEAWNELVARFSLTVKAAVASHWLTPEEQETVTRRTWAALAQRIAEEEGPLGSLGLWLSLTAHAECLKLTPSRSRLPSRSGLAARRDRRSHADRRRLTRTGSDRRRPEAW